MAGLEGTIKTPLGAVQKKTALILGGGTLVILGIVYYRQKQASDSQPTIPEAEINPATGYAYGSAEDAAALAAQAAYVSPAANTGGGGSSTIPASNVGYTSNGAWVQGVIAYMVGNGLVEDPSKLTAALGKYVTGSYVTDEEQSLIQQAIAVEGHAPVAGANGYPPSINKTPPVTTTTPPPVVTNPIADATTNVVNLKVSGTTKSTITFTWGYGTVKPDYQLFYKDTVPIANVAGNVTSFTMKNLKPNTSYKFQVRGVKGQVTGPSYAVTGKTAK